MTNAKKKVSWIATLWLVAGLGFGILFGLDYWIVRNATPLGSFAYGFLAGACVLLAVGAYRRARKKLA